MLETAAERYTRLVVTSEASRAQRPAPAGDRWFEGAARFREDPFRESPTLNSLLSFIRATDVVLDVGGGAGRYLPIATRCRQLINVEPSAAMGRQFAAAVAESGIKNATWIHGDWLSTDIAGDVTFVANVLYYISGITQFVEKLVVASRRRVMIVMHSIPPVNLGADLFRFIHGREQTLDPGYRELLPVLWDMGLLPELRVLGLSDFIAERARFTSRSEAIASAIPSSLDNQERARAATELDVHFDEVFIGTGLGGYHRRPNGRSRVLLITWRTDAEDSSPD